MSDPEPAPLAVAPSRPRRVVYLGTPEVAVPSLHALHAAGFEIPLVVTRPDRRRGRGGRETPSPVKAAALELGLRVEHDLDHVTEVGADLGVVVAYGRIIPRAVLERLPMVNIHFSLLPRWRGAAPVERALLAGDERTGVCLMEVAEGLDTGGVFARAETDIRPDDTLESLRARLVELGTQLLVEQLQAGLGRAEPQIGDPVHAAKIDASEYVVDWSLPATRIDALVRLGGAHTTFRGKRLKIWGVRPLDLPDDAGAPGEVLQVDGAPRDVVVATGDRPLALTVVQPEGRARQEAAAWRHGAQPAAGERMGE